MRLRTHGRFSVKRISRALSDRLRGTEFDRALSAAQRAGHDRFVFGWNRGLGDIALGLVPLFDRIRARVPGARIVVFTRPDLEDAFRLTGIETIYSLPGLVRGAPIDAARMADFGGASSVANAVVFPDPDPTRWLERRRQDHCPSLRWNAAWNSLADRLLPIQRGELLIGAHVTSETAHHYDYVKDWPAASWQALFTRFAGVSNVRWVLFGNVAATAFASRNITDLRGRTSFLELLALIRTRCRILVAPDSGVLTAAYYLAQDFPLEIISLWSDPRQGILKQGCPSPNPRLRHTALQGSADDVRNLTIDTVESAVNAAIRNCTAPPTRRPVDAPRP